MRQHFTLDFGIKNAGEVEMDGQVGLILEGYATRFNEVDLEGEYVAPGALDDAARTFFAGPGRIPILYDHGYDPTLSTKHIGHIVDWRIDAVGLWIKSFLPKPTDVLDAVGRRTLEVWNGVKSGAISGASIGGLFWRLGQAIKKVGLCEVSVTATPCLPSAQMSLSRKSLPAVDAYAAQHPLGLTHSFDPADPHAFVSAVQAILSHGATAGMSAAAAPASRQSGHKGSYASDADTYSACAAMPTDYNDVSYNLSRAGHGTAMGVALGEKSVPLHDHLLDDGQYPAYAQSEHSPQSCPICQYRRDLHGIKKADVSTKPWGKVDKARLPRACFLDAGDPAKRSTWRYPVYEGSGSLDGEGRYTQRGKLNKNAVASATAYATQNSDSAILKKLAPLREACGFRRDGNGAAQTGKKTVPPLDPASFMTQIDVFAALRGELVALRPELVSTAEESGDGDAGTPATGAKAGRALSGSNRAMLRSFASAVIDAGQQLHAWLDKTEPPDPQDPASAKTGTGTDPDPKGGKKPKKGKPAQGTGGGGDDDDGGDGDS